MTVVVVLWLPTLHASTVPTHARKHSVAWCIDSFDWKMATSLRRVTCLHIHGTVVLILACDYVQG